MYKYIIIYLSLQIYIHINIHLFIQQMAELNSYEVTSQVIHNFANCLNCFPASTPGATKDLILLYMQLQLYIFIVITSERSERSSYQQSYMGRPVDIKSAVSQKRSILDIWCWEQKVFVLTQLVDIWSEPARPGPARPDRNAL